MADGTVSSRNGCECNLLNAFCGSGERAVRVCEDEVKTPLSVFVAGGFAVLFSFLLMFVTVTGQS